MQPQYTNQQEGQYAAQPPVAVAMAVPQGQQLAPILPPKINFTAKRCNDVPAAIVSGLVFGAQIILCFVILGQALSFEGWVDAGCTCIFGQACGAGRVFPIFNDGVGKLIDKYPGFFALAVIVTFVLGALWIFLLQKFARFIVWATLAIKVVAFAAVGVWLFSDSNTGGGIVMFIAAGIVVTVMVLLRAKIDLAAEILRQAANALAARPGMFGAALILQAVMMAYLVLVFFAFLKGFFVGDWVRLPGRTVAPFSCEWQEASYINPVRYYLAVAMVWGVATIRMTRAYMLTFSTGIWYFHQQDNDVNKPAMPAVTGFKLAMQAWGTNAMAGFIVTLANLLQSVAANKCLRLSPIGWVLYCLVYFMKTCLEFLSKFAIIISGVSGLDFWGSAKQGYEMLKRHFVGGYVTNRVGFSVMTLGATVFSLLIGILIWGSISADEGTPMFYTRRNGIIGNADSVLSVIFAIFGLIMHAFPFFGIVMIALIGTFLAELVGGAFIFGILCGIISHFLFDYIAGVVLDCVDAIFVFQAIDRDNGTMSIVGQDIYKALIQMPELSNWKQAPNGGSYQPMVGSGTQMTTTPVR